MDLTEVVFAPGLDQRTGWADDKEMIRLFCRHVTMNFMVLDLRPMDDMDAHDTVFIASHPCKCGDLESGRSEHSVLHIRNVRDATVPDSLRGKAEPAARRTRLNLGVALTR